MRISLAIVGLALIGSAAAYAQDMDLMQFADADKDGKVTQTEYAAFAEQGWGFFSNGADKVKLSEMDPMMRPAFNGITPDADGNVTHKAYTDSVPARFKAADKNADGTLDSKELNAMMQPAG